jgi:hypothetical protein
VRPGCVPKGNAYHGVVFHKERDSACCDEGSHGVAQAGATVGDEARRPEWQCWPRLHVPQEARRRSLSKEAIRATPPGPLPVGWRNDPASAPCRARVAVRWQPPHLYTVKFNSARGFVCGPPRIGVPSNGPQTGRPSPMAKFKRLTLHGTADKVMVNMDLVLFVRPFERYSAIFFSEQHSMVVAESVNDILQAESLPNA